MPMQLPPDYEDTEFQQAVIALRLRVMELPDEHITPILRKVDDLVRIHKTYVAHLKALEGVVKDHDARLDVLESTRR